MRDRFKLNNIQLAHSINETEDSFIIDTSIRVGLIVYKSIFKINKKEVTGEPLLMLNLSRKVQTKKHLTGNQVAIRMAENYIWDELFKKHELLY
jgi:hypothetical protein